MKMTKVAGCLAALLFITALTCGVYADDEEKLNLNAATVKELVKIPGLNKELAEKIIELREENGEFIDMEELLDIPGINNQLLRQLKKHLYIEPVDDCNC
jgi:competence ComEA-like helix-hairpin-helix protein